LSAASSSCFETEGFSVLSAMSFLSICRNDFRQMRLYQPLVEMQPRSNARRGIVRWKAYTGERGESSRNGKRRLRRGLRGGERLSYALVAGKGKGTP
jgi:hypothetical protein